MPLKENQKRGRNNRNRGQRFETWLKRDLEADGWTVFQQGGPGQRDLHIHKQIGQRELNRIEPASHIYSVEAKTHTNAATKRMDEGPTESERHEVLKQAYQQAGFEEAGIGIIKYTQAKRTSIWVVSLLWPVEFSEPYEDWKQAHR